VYIEANTYQLLSDRTILIPSGL